MKEHDDLPKWRAYPHLLKLIRFCSWAHYYRESVLGLQTGSTAKTCLGAFTNLILSLSAFQRMKSAEIMAWLYVIECVSKVQQRQKVLLWLQTGSTAKSCLAATASASLYYCCLLFQLSSRDLLRSGKERKSKPHDVVQQYLTARERRTVLKWLIASHINQTWRVIYTAMRLMKWVT